MTDEQPTVVAMPMQLLAGYLQISPYQPNGVDAEWSSVTGIIGIRDYFGTQDADGVGDAAAFEQRISRCYELAMLGMLRDWPDEGMLVHGSIHGPGEDMHRIAHAWLRVRTKHGVNLVWEPITRLVHLQADWEQAARAREERAYDLHTTTRLMVTHNHYGPWAPTRYR